MVSAEEFGYGATPSNWKGWLATALFVVAMAGSRPIIQLLFAGRTAWLVWTGVVMVLTVSFVALAWFKTEGAWRWSWGAPERD